MPIAQLGKSIQNVYPFVLPRYGIYAVCRWPRPPYPSTSVTFTCSSCLSLTIVCGHLIATKTNTYFSYFEMKTLNWLKFLNVISNCMIWAQVLRSLTVVLREGFDSVGCKFLTVEHSMRRAVPASENFVQIGHLAEINKKSADIHSSHRNRGSI